MIHVFSHISVSHLKPKNASFEIQTFGWEKNQIWEQNLKFHRSYRIFQPQLHEKKPESPQRLQLPKGEKPVSPKGFRGSHLERLDLLTNVMYLFTDHELAMPGRVCVMGNSNPLEAKKKFCGDFGVLNTFSKFWFFYRIAECWVDGRQPKQIEKFNFFKIKTWKNTGGLKNTSTVWTKTLLKIFC